MKRIPGRIVVELDDVASALLRAQMAGAIEDGCLPPGGDTRDLASASIIFMLDPDDDCTTTKERLCQAQDRRELGEGKAVPMTRAVIIELTPRQYELALRMAKYDQKASLASWIKSDLEESVVCSADCFTENQHDTRAVWNGEDRIIRKRG